MDNIQNSKHQIFVQLKYLIVQVEIGMMKELQKEPIQNEWSKSQIELHQKFIKQIKETNSMIELVGVMQKVLNYDTAKIFDAYII